MEEEKTLEEQARRKIVERAFIGVMPASVLAFFTVLFTTLTISGGNILDIPNLLWLLFGLGGYGTLVWSRLNDENANAAVVDKLLETQFDPKEIRNRHLRSRVQEALDYRKRIAAQIATHPEDSVLRVQLEGTADQFDVWIEEIHMLSTRLDTYLIEERPRLQKGTEDAKQRQAQLKRRLQTSKDDKLSADLRKSITNLDRQLSTTDSLHTTMHRAELRLEDTITAMATIYPQTMLLDAKDIDSSRFRRLQQEIAEEVTELADVLHAMDDVYAES